MSAPRHGPGDDRARALLAVAGMIVGVALWLGLAGPAEACHPVRLDALSAYGGAADHGCGGGIIIRLPAMPAPPSEPAADPDVLPPVVALAIQDLAARTGLPPESITVVELQAVEWPDSSLGCPQPGFFYLQVITPGYRIVLAAGGQRYEYHTDQGRRAVLCQAAALAPPAEPAPPGEAPSESETASPPAPDAGAE